MSSLQNKSVLELIGSTPLVRINRLNSNSKVDVYAKLEFFNPGGSVKDRPALKMIEAAEASGLLTKEKIVLEATSGNTGIGLAMVCAVKGYKTLFVMSEAASEERRKILKAYGADILLTSSRLSTDGAIEKAYHLAREYSDRYFLVDQFNNDNNWRSHAEEGTAKEIFEATKGKVKMVVSSMGTTGTLMGLIRGFKKLNKKVKIVGVEPYQGHKIQGLKNMKESYAPGIFDRSEVERIEYVNDAFAYEMTRKLALMEGLFVGMSSGAAMWVAIKLAREMEKGTIVVILPDSGERYLSTSLFNEEKKNIFLRAYNTLSNKVEKINPIYFGKMGIYACGPSLDGPPGLNLCRRMIFADLVHRWLLFRKFNVKLIINISDVDDRTVKQSLLEKEDLKKFTRKWEKVFFESMEKLKILPAYKYSKASMYIDEMIQETKKLLNKGFAYEKLKSVYFDVNSFSNYGKLSGINLKKIKRRNIKFDTYEKENPKDFVLFKRASLAELKAGIYWKTPWGNVRPGWHIECAVMSVYHLGQPFDLHLASSDLIFPHGDNEIALMESLNNDSLARMWLHSKLVNIDGKRKSRLGQKELTLQDLVAEGWNLSVIRFWLLSCHYRRSLSYSLNGLLLAEKAVSRINRFILRLSFLSSGNFLSNFDQILYETKREMFSAMDLDFGISKFIAILFRFIKKINKCLALNFLDFEQRIETLSFMEKVDSVLSVMTFYEKNINFDVDSLLSLRDSFRKKGNFQKADNIRDLLKTKGVHIEDTPQGSFWYKK